MKQNKYGRNACIIGEVRSEPQGIVAMKTGFGGTRIVDMLAGEQLPRICQRNRLLKIYVHLVQAFRRAN